MGIAKSLPYIGPFAVGSDDVPAVPSPATSRHLQLVMGDDNKLIMAADHRKKPV